MSPDMSGAQIVSSDLKNVRLVEEAEVGSHILTRSLVYS